MILVERRPYLSATVLAIATILVFLVLPDSWVQPSAAVLLAVIAGAYGGFAAKDGRVSAVLIELGGILVFGLLAVVGLREAMVLAAGYLAHGLWDLAHHRPGPQADLPGWWIPLCVVYDWLVGVFLAVWWW